MLRTDDLLCDECGVAAAWRHSVCEDAGSRDPGWMFSIYCDLCAEKDEDWKLRTPESVWERLVSVDPRLGVTWRVEPRPMTTETIADLRCDNCKRLPFAGSIAKMDRGTSRYGPRFVPGPIICEHGRRDEAAIERAVMDEAFAAQARWAAVLDGSSITVRDALDLAFYALPPEARGDPTLTYSMGSAAHAAFVAEVREWRQSFVAPWVVLPDGMRPDDPVERHGPIAVRLGAPSQPPDLVLLAAFENYPPFIARTEAVVVRGVGASSGGANG